MWMVTEDGQSIYRAELMKEGEEKNALEEKKRLDKKAKKAKEIHSLGLSPDSMHLADVGKEVFGESSLSVQVIDTIPYKS